jgi:hypothetical protein
MHDTCIFLDTFWKTVTEAASECTSYIKLKQEYSANTGLFSVNWFIRNRKELFSYFINYEKELALAYKASNYPNKDVIYKKFNNLPKHLGEDAVFTFENFLPLGPIFNYMHGNPSFIMCMYSNEPRKGNIFSPGIIKFNKNWRGGEEEDFQWNLDL